MIVCSTVLGLASGSYAFLYQLEAIGGFAIV